MAIERHFMNKRAVSIIEVLIVGLLFTLITAAASQIIAFNLNSQKRLQAESGLQQDAMLVINHLRKYVMNSSSVDVKNSNKNLALYDKESNLIGTYTTSGINFSYGAEIISKRIKSIKFTNPDDESAVNPEGLRIIKVEVSTQDPDLPKAKSPVLTALIACRLPSSTLGGTGLVRVVASNRTTVRGYYNTIQEAISNATTVNTDIVQVSSNNKTPYDENVNIRSKNLTLEGCYDSTNWVRHSGDPNYETIIRNTVTADPGLINSVVYYTSNAVNASFTIDGFTITNSNANNYHFKAIRVYIPTVKTRTVKISNCKVKDINLVSTNHSIRLHGIWVDAGRDKDGEILIENNEITNITAEDSYSLDGAYSEGIRVNTAYNGTTTIRNNRINNVSVRYSGTLTGESRQASGIRLFVCAGRIRLLNNNIVNISSVGGSSGAHADGIRYWGTADKDYPTNSIIANNSISNISATNSGQTGLARGMEVLNAVYNTPLRIYNNFIDTVSGGNQSYGIDASGNYPLIDLGTGTYALCSIVNNEIKDIGSEVFGRVAPLYVPSNNTSVGAPLEIHNNKITLGANNGYGIQTNYTYAPVISNNTVIGNSKGGSGIYYSGDNSNFPICILNRNKVSGVEGNGLLVTMGRVDAKNNLIIKNTTGINLGSALGSNLENNTIHKNIQNGIQGSNFGVRNSIIYDNTNEISSGNTVTYSCVKGSYSENGNISDDPLFVDTANDDYHLKPASPCLIASDIGHEIGAYGSLASGTVGFAQPADDTGTPDINERVIGTY